MTIEFIHTRQPLEQRLGPHDVPPLDDPAMRAARTAYDANIPNMSSLAGEATLIRNDRYVHETVTEQSDPETVRESWRIHAEGYHTAGFVSDDAITVDGSLAEAIDKSRGEHTDYYIARNPDNPEDVATMRKVNLAVGETCEDLPAFQLCKDGLTQESLSFLENLKDPDTRLKEISALAITSKGSPIGAHEIFRRVIQEALGKNEVWLFSIVSSTYSSLAKNFSELNLRVIGDDATIDDPRVSKEISLKPVIVNPNRFIDNLLISFYNAENAIDRTRYKRSFLFFTDGLDREQMSSRVYDARQGLLRTQKTHG